MQRAGTGLRVASLGRGCAPSLSPGLEVPDRGGPMRYSPKCVVRAFSEIHIRDAAYMLLKRQPLPF